MWLEIDMYDERALREVKDAAPMPICSGENLYGLRGYRPFFEARAMDVVMIDVPWNGFAPSRKVADLAETYELNVAPHNYYSHLSTLHSLHLCATVPNVRIMEIDVDDVPWKDELVDAPPVIERGEVVLPTRPGLGRRSQRGGRPPARVGARVACRATWIRPQGRGGRPASSGSAPALWIISRRTPADLPAKRRAGRALAPPVAQNSVWDRRHRGFLPTRGGQPTRYDERDWKPRPSFLTSAHP